MDYGQFGIALAIIAFWIVLNRWVLPWFGISTCCACAADRGCPVPDGDQNQSGGDES